MFANTRLFSPVAIYGVTGAPENSTEWRDWWTEEARRCLFGYSVAGTKITGRHYHYLNHWKIRARDLVTGRKRLMYPRFQDIDYDFFMELDRAEREKKNFMYLKCRQRGGSSKVAHIAGYDFQFIEGSQTVITAGEEKLAKTTFRMVKRGIEEMKDREFAKHAQPESDDYMYAAFTETINGVSREVSFGSSLHRIVAKDVQALISLSPSKVIWEEMGKFPDIIETMAYIEPAMENEGERTGMNILIGTGGEPGQAIQDVTEMMFNPERYSLLNHENIWSDEDELGIETKKLTRVPMFCPAYRGLLYDSEGNSLEAESRAKLEAKRKSLEGDRKKWTIEVTQNPFTIEEALLTPDGGRFDTQRLRNQKSRILRDENLRYLVQVGNLNWMIDADGVRTGVEWEPDPVKGRFRIVEHPETNRLGKIETNCYVAGTDSYDKDKAADIKRSSDGSCYIYKRFNSFSKTSDIFVASVTERPETSAEFYEDSAKLCIYYGRCQNLIEWSNIMIFDWYQRNNCSDLLKEKPMLAYSHMIEGNTQNRYGLDPSTKTHWINAMADYIVKFSHRIMDLEHLEKLIAFKEEPKYNCDRTIASSLALVHNLDLQEMLIKPKKEAFNWSTYAVKNGRIINY